MRNRLIKVAIICAFMALPASATSQIYAKLNTIYAVIGIINPQLEFVVGPHSSIVIDPTYSPWRSVKGKHFNFVYSSGAPDNWSTLDPAYEGNYGIEFGGGSGLD